MNQLIFIIGGAGYIGSHMVKYASQAGYDVVTLDNLSTGHRDAVKYGKFEFCDLANVEKLDYLFKKYCPLAVVHFGGISIVSDSVVDPSKYFSNNVIGSINLLNAMVNNDCKKIIFSSSASVYGSPEYIPIDEDHPTNPMNPYGKSKLIVEKILEDYDIAYGIKYINFRYFNAAGHDLDGELTERHNPETHLIPLLLRAALGKDKNVEIFGTDYKTRDGTCVRDFIHVKDLCEAHLKGLASLNDSSKKLNSNCFNLGSSKGFSVKEVIEEVNELTGVDLEINKKPRRSGDPSVLIASNEKAKKILNFSPQIVNLKDIIKTLI